MCAASAQELRQKQCGNANHAETQRPMAWQASKAAAGGLMYVVIGRSTYYLTYVSHLTMPAFS
jgi:hypothetical protein